MALFGSDIKWLPWEMEYGKLKSGLNTSVFTRYKKLFTVILSSAAYM